MQQDLMYTVVIITNTLLGSLMIFYAIRMLRRGNRYKKELKKLMK